MCITYMSVSSKITNKKEDFLKNTRKIKLMDDDTDNMIPDTFPLEHDDAKYGNINFISFFAVIL